MNEDSLDNAPKQVVPETSQTPLSTLGMSDISYGESTSDFEELREKILQEQRQKILERFKNNPAPDEEELSASAYREEIEPQCRDAIFAMRRKGYHTISSGFGRGNQQMVDGGFDFGEETIQLLRQNGYEVLSVSAGEAPVRISFVPVAADMQEITTKWNKLAEVLPDLGHPAPPLAKDIADFDKDFRDTYPYFFMDKN